MAETLTNSINKMSVDDENMQEVKMENDFNKYCKNILSFLQKASGTVGSFIPGECF